MRSSRGAEPGRRRPVLAGQVAWVRARPRNLERIALAVQRASGVGILAYLFFHVVVTGTIVAGPGAWEGLMAALANPAAHAGEVLVVAGATFHAVNGIRMMLLELTSLVGGPARPDYPYRTQSLGRPQRSLIYVATLMAGLSALAGVAILWGA